MKSCTFALSVLMATTALSSPSFAQLRVPETNLLERNIKKHVWFPPAWSRSDMQSRMEVLNAETLNLEIEFAFAQGLEGMTPPFVATAADNFMFNAKAVPAFSDKDVVAVICTYGVDKPMCAASTSIHGLKITPQELTAAIGDASFLRDVDHQKAPDMATLHTFMHDAVLNLEKALIKNGAQEKIAAEHERHVTVQRTSSGWIWWIIIGSLVIGVWFMWRRRRPSVAPEIVTTTSAPVPPPAPRPVKPAPRPVKPAPGAPVVLPPNLVAMRKRIQALEVSRVVNGRTYASHVDTVLRQQLWADYYAAERAYVAEPLAYIRLQQALESELELQTNLATFYLVQAVYAQDRSYWQMVYADSGYNPSMTYDAWYHQPGATLVINDYNSYVGAYVPTPEQVTFANGDTSVVVPGTASLPADVDFGGGDSTVVTSASEPASAPAKDEDFGGGDNTVVTSASEPASAPTKDEDFGGGDNSVQKTEEPAKGTATDDVDFGGGDKSDFGGNNDADFGGGDDADFGSGDDS